MRIKLIFHINGFALSLAMKQRLELNQKGPNVTPVPKNTLIPSKHSCWPPSLNIHGRDWLLNLRGKCIKLLLITIQYRLKLRH